MKVTWTIKTEYGKYVFEYKPSTATDKDWKQFTDEFIRRMKIGFEQ